MQRKCFAAWTFWRKGGAAKNSSRIFALCNPLDVGVSVTNGSGVQELRCAYKVARGRITLQATKAVPKSGVWVIG